MPTNLGFSVMHNDNLYKCLICIVCALFHLKGRNELTYIY